LLTLFWSRQLFNIALQTEQDDDATFAATVITQVIDKLLMVV
jgi:hypothetical protein